MRLRLSGCGMPEIKTSVSIENLCIVQSALLNKNQNDKNYGGDDDADYGDSHSSKTFPV